MQSEYFGAGRLVLVVDDHADFCEAMQHLLTTLGFRVACAANGLEALERLKREPPYLVLTDLFMPHMDGIELMVRLKKAEPPIPLVIAVSGDHVASEAVSGTAAALGAEAVLVKPVTREQLAAAISLAEKSTIRWTSEERRTRTRTTREMRATSLIQGIITDPSKTANDMAAELQNGGNPSVIFSLLRVAQSIAALRKIDLNPQIATIRTHLTQAGFHP
jgi:CheY-like chemotaxis protein